MIFGHSFLQRIYKVVIQALDLAEIPEGFKALTPSSHHFRLKGVSNIQ